MIPQPIIGARIIDNCGCVIGASNELAAGIIVATEAAQGAGCITGSTGSVSPGQTTGTGGFWLGTLGPAAATPGPGLAQLMDAASAGPAEAGFISSQPSIAEFMTAMPPNGQQQQQQQQQMSMLMQSEQGSEVTGPMGSPGHHGAYHHAIMEPMGPNGVVVGGAGGGQQGQQDPMNVPEYPWMKEKKTTRKSSQQGEILITITCMPSAGVYQDGRCG
ncbi:hypothetical protein QAD02_005443 [Eretmocerus hayati]|uniref:Uncharacterized protein n=1 Tax=Eretmocerus hayati TaxID=131215 RepID=A0ACC2NSR9_9HYME|nr:hypothetical protein QAD02_005443 [Eretmocerus hayati]